MSNTLIIIPSRLSAKRLPGKPLLKIKDKSIIVHVLNKAKQCKIGKVIVATEDKKILNEVRKNNGQAILTSKNTNPEQTEFGRHFKKLKIKKLSIL